MHEAIRQWARRNHRDRWKRMSTCRQARQILDQPSESHRSTCCQLRRNEIHQLISVVTGHSTLKGHLHRMGLIADPTCDLCGNEVEDRNHFLCRCDALCLQRLTIFGAATMEPCYLSEIPLRLNLEFIKKSKRFDKDTGGLIRKLKLNLESLKWALLA